MTTTTEQQPTVPAPAQRVAFLKVAEDVYQAMVQATKAAQAGFDPALAELVKIRASMINGCAFCIDMHVTEARRAGEAEHRIHALSAWRETPYYTARERAGLALAESVTLLTEGHVPDAVHQEAARHFDENELARLISITATINAWNRIAVASRLSPAPK
ncbi:carboxymuconolactone decarboxylase family protein [Kitasatospora sp. NBC_01287]|uniref:carboxymuconolactone decarboxylase family protein n=1 Tax=Kitasatospora sp. NBC_01287 TaxID=2903573 RepID=UPI00225704C9|nr:carboxymuconolactone decarboxylase family protein [Kitasatospora sp. NBC_01287]MCX4747464.1 carboxymuconolactone decarboxylase family protein [Kitasatospora sp. NBC_01287]